MGKKNKRAYAASIAEKRRDLILISVSENRKQKKILAVDVIADCLFEEIGWDNFPPFFTKQGFISAIGHKTSDTTKGLLYEALFQTLSIGYGHFHDAAKIVDSMNMQQVESAWTGENALIRDPKEATPVTYELKATKPKKIDANYEKALNRFFETSTTSKK